jgi:hypothetical protein
MFEGVAYLRIISGVTTIRRVGAGSYRSVFILGIFRGMFRVYACTGNVFRRVR